MTSWITICDTCKRDGWDKGDTSLTDGERLATEIETCAQGLEGVKTRRVSCTMGCVRACNVGVQAHGKQTYVLGKFEATPLSAQAIVDYAKLHSASETGQVPFKQWPQGIKGHFVTRLPAVPAEE